MTTTVFEFLRVLVLGCLFVGLIAASKRHKIMTLDGGPCIIKGVLLVFMACVLDFIDNFQQLDRFLLFGSFDVQSFFKISFGYVGGYIIIAIGLRKWLNQVIAYTKQNQDKLQEKDQELKTLKGLIPICMHCKGIRDDKGSWNRLEVYIESHSDAQFSHGICEDCLEEHYGKEVVDSIKKRNSAA